MFKVKAYAAPANMATGYMKFLVSGVKNIKAVEEIPIIIAPNENVFFLPSFVYNNSRTKEAPTDDTYSNRGTNAT